MAALRADILTCDVRCSCVRQNADREKPAFWRTQLQLIAEISAIIMTQANMLKTPLFRQISTLCQDVWRVAVCLGATRAGNGFLLLVPRVMVYRLRFEMSGMKWLFQLDFTAPAGHGKMPTA
jgi:hypothetical protein